MSGIDVERKPSEPTNVSAQTEAWYKSYREQKGEDRNDILRNRGVLFQRMAIHRSVVEALRSIRAERDWKVLDVGCSVGGSLIQFLAFGFPPSRLYGIDIRPERLQKARETFPNIKFVCGDASKTEYQSGFFRLVFESTMFVQILDESLAQRVAEEMLRVLRPQGYDHRLALRFR